MVLPITQIPIVTTVDVYILLFSPLNDNFDLYGKYCDVQAVGQQSTVETLVDNRC
jgi:hypothetical protein